MSLNGFPPPLGRSAGLRQPVKGHYCLELGHQWDVVANLIAASNHLRATAEHLLAQQYEPRLPRLALRRSTQPPDCHLELLHSQQWKLARDWSNYSLSIWGCHFFRCKFRTVLACQSRRKGTHRIYDSNPRSVCTTELSDSECRS